MSIDIEKVRESQLVFNGLAKTKKREALIEEAIKMAMTGDIKKLERSYLGLKDYAGFVEQRSDHDYGYGPKHGSVCFRIQRSYRVIDESKVDQTVYALLAARDYKGVEIEKGKHLGLFEALSLKLKLERQLREIEESLNFEIEE